MLAILWVNQPLSTLGKRNTGYEWAPFFRKRIISCLGKQKYLRSQMITMIWDANNVGIRLSHDYIENTSDLVYIQLSFYVYWSSAQCVVGRAWITHPLAKQTFPVMNKSCEILRRLTVNTDQITFRCDHFLFVAYISSMFL